jgi:DNA-binding NarL/FixJ family response regulator
MRMSDTVYQVVLGDPLGENARLWDDALRACPFFSLVHSATDISGLVSYLAGAGKFVDKTRHPSPDLVLLDLNLSGRGSGFDVLKWIQAQASRSYRVVVLSSAVENLLCEQAYALGADGFVTQPGSVDEMIRVLIRIEGWVRSSVVEDDPLEFCVA